MERVYNLPVVRELLRRGAELKLGSLDSRISVLVTIKLDCLLEERLNLTCN